MALSLNDRLARNANNLAGKIYKNSIVDSPFNALVMKEEWMNGISDTQKVLTVDRNLPDNIDTWTAVASPNSESNNCAIAGDVVPRGYTERSTSLDQKAIESERICVNDTRNAYNPTEQIRIAYEQLKNSVKYAWKRRAMVDYAEIAEYKVVAANGLPYNDASFPAIAATSTLTQKILNKYYAHLLHLGAQDEGGALGKMDGGRPGFVLVTDMETSDDIMRESQNFTAFAESNRVPELLSNLGVDRAFRGFYHTIDLMPRRYTFSGGVWTEVDPWLTVAATNGVKKIVNPDWISAPYTDSYIFVPTVMSFLHPKPISTMGSKTAFNPQTYVGEFTWLNEKLLDPSSAYYNPDGDWGFYRAKLMSATKPIHPEFGIVIRHLRCPSDIGAQACPESTAGASSDLGSGDSFFV